MSVEERLCGYCKNPLERHTDERAFAFRVRKTCGVACASAARELSRRQKRKVKLTDDMVRAMKWMLVGGDKVDVVAKAYGVSITTIRNIQSEVTWRHVEI